MNLTIEPVRLANRDDDEGVLVYDMGRLVAVLSHLSPQHEDRAGHWFLECAFGGFPYASAEFASLDEAQAWIEDRLVS